MLEQYLLKDELVEYLQNILNDEELSLGNKKLINDIVWAINDETIKTHVITIVNDGDDTIYSRFIKFMEEKSNGTRRN